MDMEELLIFKRRGFKVKQNHMRLFLAIVFIVLLGSVVILNASKNKIQQDFLEQEQELIALNEEIESLKTIDYEELEKEKKEVLKRFFKSYLDYTNENYLKRYDEMSSYASKNIIDKLRGAQGELNESVKFRNQLEKLEIFHTKNQDRFLVVTTINYTAASENIVLSDISNLYEVEMKDKKIEKLILKGTITEVDDV